MRNVHILLRKHVPVAPRCVRNFPALFSSQAPQQKKKRMEEEEVFENTLDQLKENLPQYHTIHIGFYIILIMKKKIINKKKQNK